MQQQKKNGKNIINKKLQTLDLEFSEYCHELLGNGMDGIDFLRVLNQYGFIWEASRRRCADLCIERGEIGMAEDIMVNADGSIDELWIKENAR